MPHILCCCGIVVYLYKMCMVQTILGIVLTLSISFIAYLSFVQYIFVNKYKKNDI